MRDLEIALFTVGNDCRYTGSAEQRQVSVAAVDPDQGIGALRLSSKVRVENDIVLIFAP
jgi:hypothetical protein